MRVSLPFSLEMYLRCPTMMTSFKRLVSADIRIFPISFVVIGNSIVLYPMQLIFATIGTSGHDMEKRPFSSLTPPVMRELFIFDSNEIEANDTGLPSSSIINPIKASSESLAIQ